MRMVLTNFGTRGDVQPLLSLGAELVAHGHTAIYAVPPSAAVLVREHGFEPECIGPDLTSLRDQISSDWVANGEIDSSPEQLWRLLHPLQQHFRQVFDQLHAICMGADVLVAGPAQPVARVIHEVCAIPFVSVQFCHFGGNGGPALRLASEMLVNPFRRSLGLPALSDPLTINANSPQLALYAMSAHLRSKPMSWPRHRHITGFFFGSRDAIPSASLIAFMESGPAPVSITFGSMIHSEEDFVPMIARAVQKTGCRAVIQSVPGRTSQSVNSSSIYLAESLPHDWLFPRSSCVVLHGGAGTTAAVLRAGVPGIFVPHGYDQRYWARYVLSSAVLASQSRFLNLQRIGLRALSS